MQQKRCPENIRSAMATTALVCPEKYTSLGRKVFTGPKSLETAGGKGFVRGPPATEHGFLRAPSPYHKTKLS
jgi:hypothetical protein